MTSSLSVRLMWAFLSRKTDFSSSDLSRKGSFIWNGTLVGQKRFDHGRCLLGLRHHKEMPVVDQAQSRVWYQLRQNATVDHRNQRIVAAHQDERRLRQRPKPRQARPPGHGEKLI